MTILSDSSLARLQKNRPQKKQDLYKNIPSYLLLYIVQSTIRYWHKVFLGTHIWENSLVKFQGGKESLNSGRKILN